MDEFIPEDYQDRADLITKGNNHFYIPSDFENDSEILLFFSKVSRYNPKPDSIRRCLVVDANGERFKSGFGMRDALKVKVLEAWIIKGGKLEEREVKDSGTKIFYESIIGVYRVG